MNIDPSSEFFPPLLLRKPLIVDSNVEFFKNRFANFQILTMPGLHGSDADHWQSAWELWYPEFQRVEQSDWENPDLDNWARRLIETAVSNFRPVIVVAHSFGCLATVHASVLQPGLIAGALLVAPADPVQFDVDSYLPDYVLDIPTIMVASTNDPNLTLKSAERLVDRWGSQMITLKNVGHINVQSGHKSWAGGLELLESVCEKAGSVNVARSTEFS